MSRTKGGCGEGDECTCRGFLVQIYLDAIVLFVPTMFRISFRRYTNHTSNAKEHLQRGDEWQVGQKLNRFERGRISVGRYL